MKYLLIICCYLFIFITLPSSFAEEKKKYEPTAYKLINIEKDIPFIQLCDADPATVQEFFLVVEIEYLVWLYREYFVDYKNNNDKSWYKKFLESIRELLVKKLTELRDLQISCILSSSQIDKTVQESKEK